jgi:histidine kinase/histidine kinase/DNA gyrase B/HSP90-like ATPase
MSIQATALLNLLGFITGSALYAMLLAMVLREPRASQITRADRRPDRLPLLTGLLGLVWNLVAMVGLLSLGFWHSQPFFPLIYATAFTALGFLPAVVVNSVLRTNEGLIRHPWALWMTIIAYTLSAVAGALHFHHALVFGSAPSRWALHTLTVGFIGLTLALLIYTRWRPERYGQSIWTGAGWVLALAVFAVSALHLSHHEGLEFSWWIELIGHHASLPLVLAILYQDYRFALADIFLKRALSLLLLAMFAFGLYLWAAAPFVGKRDASENFDPAATGLLLGLWILTALCYPAIRKSVGRFVDTVVLRRTDYDTARSQIANAVSTHESPESVLGEISVRLAETLTAQDVRWEIAGGEADDGYRSPSGPLLPLIEQHKNWQPPKETSFRVAEVADFSGPTPSFHHNARRRTIATVIVPTSEQPQYRLLIGELAGGRRLLSDDLALLESAALAAARRIDAVRVIHERCVRDLHEEEMRKLATEAELRALRAQINPHFLFNALTTVGYLIQASPDRALDTLMRLTSLLRGVLRHSDGEFSTLGEEMELIESYLEIERARFEDRLRVMVDVPASLRNLCIPALLIQPLVENAIKHGITPQRTGGEVVILARVAGRTTYGVTGGNVDRPVADDKLQIWVRDTGAGASEIALAHGRKRGVGLANVEQRIRRHFGEAATFSIRSAPAIGTTVELNLPVKGVETSVNDLKTDEFQHTSARMYG